MNLKYLETVMMSCYQTKDLNMLEHGHSVHNMYKAIRDNPENFKLPSWFSRDLFDKIKLDPETMATYHIYHDIGKPFVKEVDDDGKSHYPGHSQASYDIGLLWGFSKPVLQLFLHDMDIHLIKDQDIPAFLSLDYPLELLLTGLAEIYANAEMFGGVDSIAFKIKFKQIEKRGKKIIDILRTKDYIS